MRHCRFRVFALLVTRVLAIGLPLCVAATVALAQAFPARPVRVVVGFAAGGQNDIPARIVASELGELWGVSAVVENRPGAGGSLAAGIVAKAPADGYTLLVCNTASHGVNPALYKKLPYDPVKDFTAVSLIGTAPNVLVVHPSAQMRTVAEFIAYAKANPGKISIAHAGIGTSQHLAIELFKSMTGADVVHVPYKGGAPALADVMGGQVPASVSGLPTALAAINSGRVRALGVTSAARSPQAPEVPTIAESGVPGFEVVSWTGICAPAGLPRPILAKLNGDLVQVLGRPALKQRLAEQGVDASASTPEQLDTWIKSEITKWTKVVKDSGMTAE